MNNINYWESILKQLRNPENADNEYLLSLKSIKSPDQIGHIISALANTAVLEKKQYLYAIVENDAENQSCIDGFKREDKDFLTSNVNFQIQFLESSCILIEVQSAINTTVQYKGIEYILVDKQIDTLSKYQDKEKIIWRNLDNPQAFEEEIALENISFESIEKLLDCRKIFEILKFSYPNTNLGVINLLIKLRFIKEQNTGKYCITNLGAILAARRLSLFPALQFKAIRVITYSGDNVTCSASEQIGGKGYLLGFEGLINFVMKQLPTKEVIDGAIRKNTQDFPILSIRELIANALIHQDFKINGSPVIEIFVNRIEINNPGIPQIKIERFIDHPPISRNEALAAIMHKAGICEERGSGYDKIIDYVEKHNLPAPQITVYDKRIKVTLYAKKDFNDLTKEDRKLACYNHTVLNYVQGKVTNNSTLRDRFQLDKKDSYKISRIFTDTLSDGLIKIKSDSGTKNREYIPTWVHR